MRSLNKTGSSSHSSNTRRPSDLPAILGLRSIRDKEGVLETGAGWERFSFPAPRGSRIELSPSSLHPPLENAPSGHMIMPCCEYDKVRDQSDGLPQPGSTFHATRSGVAAPAVSFSASAGELSLSADAVTS